MNRFAIIAGNAPSLREIDYTRLPPPPIKDSCPNRHYDVFRCNQFYFEDKYYLGKDVAFAFGCAFNYFEQYYTQKALHYDHQYNIKNLVISSFDFSHIDSFVKQHREVFSDVIYGGEVLQKLKEFFAFIRYNEMFHNKRITSGIYMCGFAVALGYRDIYLAGIDFYKNEAYAFLATPPNLLKLNPSFDTKPGEFHHADVDIGALNFLQKHYGARFYSLCPNSPISSYIPLADSNSANPAYILESKPKNALKDMLIPSRLAYNKLNHANKNKDSIYGIYEYEQAIRKNIYFILLRDLVRLPSAIKKYIQGKRHQKQFKHSEMGGGSLKVANLGDEKVIYCYKNDSAIIMGATYRNLAGNTSYEAA